MAVLLKRILDEFDDLLKLESGGSDRQIKQICAPEGPKPQSLIFCHDLKLLKKEDCSQVVAFVSPKQICTQLKDIAPEATLISCENPQLALALTARKFFTVAANKEAFEDQQHHPSAVIARSARVHESAIVGPNVTIGERVEIEPNCIIGANTTIEADVKIGAGSHVHPQVYIGHATMIGKRCEIQPQTSIGTEGYGYAHTSTGEHHRITHFGAVHIEDDVHIGAGVQIDRGTFADSRIGRGTKIDNHCHFGHNAVIGKYCLITGGFISAGSVEVGDYCVIGGRTTVSGHLKIADKCQLAGLTGVQKGIDQSGIYGGYPVQDLKSFLKTVSSLPHLPEMRKTLVKLQKQVENLINSSDKEML